MLAAIIKSTLGEIKVSKTQNGVTYLNISSESKYPICRTLHPSAKHPFTHPIYGSFLCLEAFRWYLAGGCITESLRLKYGHAMSVHGRSSKRVSYLKELDSLVEAFGLQIAQNPKLQEAMEEIKANHLKPIPLTYFTVWGNTARDMNKISTPMIDIILAHL
jgi:hypothetical protein